MTPELGHLGLIAAFLFSLLQVGVGTVGCVRQNAPLMHLTKISQYAAFIATALAFFGLVWAFITSDFSFALIAQHSHSQKPMIYKIAGTWGNHEGSLLLWVLILTLFGAVFCLTSHQLPIRLAALIATVQGLISSAFFSFSLFSSNPFVRLESPPIEGHGLNPVLQDIGLAMHPPMLYLGYVGLSIAFAFAVAGLIDGRIDKRWANALKPWVSAAWCTLTAGIALGSWWAYYELGWGGWWFWDPVENASLMPWLIATALLHSLRVLEAREIFKSWTVLLAILGFSLSLLGTFIVRSGLLTSVHSFASDPTRGVFILAILLVAIGIPLLLYLWRAPSLTSHGEFSLHSREMALMLNNTVLVSSMLIVLLGTFYPMALELWNGKKISVGPPYFYATFNPVMAIGLIGMGIAGLFAWKRGLFSHAKPAIVITAVVALAVFVVLLTTKIDAASLAGLVVLAWLVIGIAGDIILRLKPYKLGLFSRTQKLGMSIWAMWLAHLGIVFFLAGAMGEHLLEQEAIVRVNVGDTIPLDDRQYIFTDIVRLQGPNYQTLQARLELQDLVGNTLGTLSPERRYYPAEAQFTTEAAIRSTWLGDDYAVLGDGNAETGYSLRLYYKPLITWIWLGAMMLVLGGLLGWLAHQRNRTPCG